MDVVVQKTRCLVKDWTSADITEYQKRVRSDAQKRLDHLDGKRTKKAARERKLHEQRIVLVRQHSSLVNKSKAFFVDLTKNSLEADVAVLVETTEYHGTLLKTPTATTTTKRQTKHVTKMKRKRKTKDEELTKVLHECLASIKTTKANTPPRIREAKRRLMLIRDFSLGEDEGMKEREDELTGIIKEYISAGF